MAERILSEVVELDIDKCQNVYGESPCKAGRRFSPTLDFDFIGDAPSLTPVIGSATVTFTRSGATATRVNPAGLLETVAADTARFDYDPLTLDAKGFLLEETRTNLLLRSAEIDNAAWSSINTPTITANSDVAPDGATAADTIGDDSATTHEGRGQSVSISADTVIRCASIFVKKGAGGAPYPGLHLVMGTNRFRLDLDTATGAVSNYAGSAPTAFGVIEYANYWRIWISGPNDGAATTATMELYPALTNASHVEAVSLTGSAVYWGAQLEVGRFPTSYIPTTSASATRNADSALISSIGGFWSATEGTMAIEGISHPAQTTTNQYVAEFSDGTASERVLLYRGPTDALMFVADGGATQVQSSLGAWANGVQTRLAFAFKLNDFAGSKDGATVVTDTTGTMPTVDRLRFGGNTSNTENFNGHLRRFTYYNTRLINANLQTLSGSGLIDRPNACYNVFSGKSPCQDKPNYVKGSRTIRLTGVGAPIDKTAPARPYLTRVAVSPTELDPEQGLARLGSWSAQATDDNAKDVEDDPYVRDRVTPAGSTWWRRFIARNPNTFGRQARVKRRFYDRGSFGSFVTERGIIDSVKGPNGRGEVTLSLKDPSRILDHATVPKVTSGKLIAELKAIENSGVAVAATTTTIRLAATASAVDDAYNGMEVLITFNAGAGQRRVITDYTGDTRECTVAAWLVLPDTASQYEVSGLKIQMGTGQGAQYDDPATSGKREFVRIGDEVIEYTAKSTDALTFPDSTYRAQFGSTRQDHSVDDAVILCRAWFDKLATDVVKEILLAAGYVSGDIDTAQFTEQDAVWLGDAYRITACITEPEKPSELLEDLLPQMNAVSWWDPVAQKQKLKVLLPEKVTVPALNETSNLIEGTVELTSLDDLRITQCAIFFGLRDATANLTEARNFLQGEAFIDADAEGANEYDDVKPLIVFSRWFGLENAVALKAWAQRKAISRRDAPKKLTFALDPKDSVSLAQVVDVSTSQIVDAEGDVAPARMIVTKVLNEGHRVVVTARSFPFTKRYGYIAPNGTADYPTDQVYAHISNNSGLMGNGDGGYLII